MIHFGDVFPDIFPIFSMSVDRINCEIAKEMEVFSDGLYVGYEIYCDNTFCKCTTVYIDILYIDVDCPENNKSVATLMYDWKKQISHENPCFYSEGDRSDVETTLLNIFRRTIKSNVSLSKKFNKHFNMLKKHIKTQSHLN